MAPPEGRARFQTTRWSRVQAALGTGAAADRALEELCEAYWYPLYAFARRCGHDADAACDLTQGFFARLLEKNDLAAADPARGRFRSWLLGSLKHHMANEADRLRTVKRGGRTEHFSIDVRDAEGRYAREPSIPGGEAERAYDRGWALLVIERAFGVVRARSRGPEDLAFLERVKPYLAVAELDDGEVAPLASELGTTPGAFKTRLSRLRERLWGQVRVEIAETLDDPEDVDGELRYLIGALGATGAP